jgi:hypothetical protein
MTHEYETGRDLLYSEEEMAVLRCNALNNSRYISEIKVGRYEVESRQDGIGPYFAVTWVRHEEASR